MKKFDFVVVGELCVDYLEGNENRRPGGAFYSAHAGRKMNASTAILGFTGNNDLSFFSSHMSDFDISQEYIQTVPGKSTCYRLKFVDEVLPQACSVERNESPRKKHDLLPKTDVALFYPCHYFSDYASQLHSRLNGLDVQYDIDSILSLPSLSMFNIVFISSSDICNAVNLPLTEVVDILFKKGAQVVVTKFGQGGSSVYQKDNDRIDIPAYISDYRYTIGAGDVFNTVFLLEYFRFNNIEQAGHHASMAVADFIESFTLTSAQWDFSNIASQRYHQFLHPETINSISIYLAGPFFSQGELTTVNYLYQSLTKCGFNVFSPWHNDGVIDNIKGPESLRVFDNNISAIKSSDIIIAILDYEDPGTIWECGYGYAHNKTIYALNTTNRPLNLMTICGVKLITPSIRGLIDYLYLELSENNP